MGKKSGGSSSTTVHEASPLEKAQAEASTRIAGPLGDLALRGITGIPSAGKQKAVGGALQELRRSAGIAGIEPGDPRMVDAMRQITEMLTKPDRDLLDLALSLYTGTPAIGGKTTTEASPGVMGAAAGVGQIALMLAQVWDIFKAKK
tara:strand:+ start:2851 stop:3291 length:441 start_codon:yes stop_codon:yes gene_type:complete